MMATKKKDFFFEYPLFVQQYGVLYERNEVPMTERDRKKTRQFYWVTLFFFVLFSTLGGVTFYFNASKGITIGSILFVILEMLVVGYSYYSVRRTLKRGKKLAIKAVVTSKRSGNSYEIGLSDQEYVSIRPIDYHTLDCGDIIKIEKPGTFIITFTQDITKLGSIFDPASIRNP